MVDFIVELATKPSAKRPRNRGNVEREKYTALVVRIIQCAARCLLTQEPQSEGQMARRLAATDGAGRSKKIAADAEIIPEWNTRTVFEALEPMCAVCHGEGQSSPYFASLSNFVDTIVADEASVVLGDPDESELLSLLAGSFNGPLTQMPPSGDTYFSRIEGDLSKPNLEDLRGWIARPSSVPSIDDQRTCATTHAPKLLHRLNRLEYNRSVQTLRDDARTSK